MHAMYCSHTSGKSTPPTYDASAWRNKINYLAEGGWQHTLLKLYAVIAILASILLRTIAEPVQDNQPQKECFYRQHPPRMIPGIITTWTYKSILVHRYDPFKGLTQTGHSIAGVITNIRMLTLMTHILIGTIPPT